jgi:signal peptidase I
MNTTRHTSPIAVVLVLLLPSLMFTACGGAAKSTSTSASAPTSASTHGELSSGSAVSDLHDPRFVRAYAKFVACMRVNGADYPPLGSGTAAFRALDSKSLSYQKASIRCYPLLGAALQILPKALRGFILPGAEKDIENIIKASRVGVVPYRVPSGSMAPTLEVGEDAYYKALSGPPRIGEIVIFHPPEGAEAEECGPKPHAFRVGGAACRQPVAKTANIRFIKRVAAGPGDEIYIKQGHVYLKAAGKSTFVREQDPYIKRCGGMPECNFPVPITVPPGHWFLMGDNRGESDDSRFWGPVPTSWIVGVVRWCSAIRTACAGP